MNTVLNNNDWLKYFSRACAILAIAISVIVLIGWLSNHLILAQFGPHYKPMPLLGGLMYGILGSGLLVYLYKSSHPIINYLAMIAVFFIVFIALIMIANDFTGMNFNIEQWFILTSNKPKNYAESCISPFVLINAVFIGATILLLLLTDKRTNHKLKSIAAWCMVFSLLSTYLIMIGYLYGTPLFIYTGGGELTTTSIPAAIINVTLSIGLITTIGKQYFPLRAFLGSSLFARLMRAILPVIFALSVLAGLIIVSTPQKHFDYAITTAVISIIASITLSFIIAKISISISKDIDRTHLALLQIQEKLHNSLLYNRGLIEASLDPLVTINRQGKITDVNKATEIITGAPRKQLIGSDFANYFDEHDLARKGYQEVFAKGFVKDYALTIHSMSGKKRNVLYNATLYKDAAKNIIGIFAAARDITERQQAEEEAKKYADDLVRSNQELQQFAYIASHDLQEPLRVISSYLQLIERRYKDKLDQDANEFIAFAVDGAERLQKMINDLLIYSRVDTRGNPFVETDVNTVVKQAIKNIKLSIEENHAVITYQKLPSLIADEEQLITVFQNLLSNAIKFHSPDLAPKIQIRAQKKDVEWIFSVHDNGIGIDPQYFDKLFIIFKRLVGKEYPGSGIGLVVCKRIIERHGGRIWVESELGKGASFYFTIPK